jgi:PEP-CTERM motif
MRPTVMLRNVGLAILAMLALGLGSTAQADTINIVGVDSGQFSTATVVCEFNSQTNTFTFTITNTSAITTPGSTSTITGIGFDLPPLGNASPSGLNGFTGTQAPSLSSTFIFSDADVGNVPHGFNSAVLDFAFLTGNSGNFNSGSVNDGLLPGESASFTVSGAAFAGFTEAQICNAIFVRFQNVPLAAGSGGSDVGVPGNGNPIPEPGTMLLLGSGLLGLAGAVRKRLRSTK